MERPRSILFYSAVSAGAVEQFFFIVEHSDLQEYIGL